MVLTIEGLSCMIPNPIPTLQVPPGNPSIVHLASLESYLPQDIACRLRDIEGELQHAIEFKSILEASTRSEFDKALIKACEAAADCYIEAGVLVWRGINHDYDKLRDLSSTSSRALNALFFKHHGLLQRNLFIKAVAALRVLTNIGERRIVWASSRNEPPLAYLTIVLCIAVLTTILLNYLQGKVPTAKPSSLKNIVNLFYDLAKESYKDAIKNKLFENTTVEMFYNPEWQKGEVEADLDKYLGNVKHFDSVESLLRDLR